MDEDIPLELVTLSSSPYVLDRIASFVYKTVPALFFVIGVSTNLLSVLVYSKKKMRKSTYSLYLLLLAIVDLVVILLGPTRYMIIAYFGIDIRKTSLISCRMHKFFTYFFSQLSSCLLSILSIDRFSGVVLAVKAFNFNRNKWLAHRISLCTIVVLILVNMHILIWYGYEQKRLMFNSTFSLNQTRVS
jgi:hypothetical protein